MQNLHRFWGQFRRHTILCNAHSVFVDLLSDSTTQNLLDFCCQFIVWLYMQDLLTKHELIALIDNRIYHQSLSEFANLTTICYQFAHWIILSQLTFSAIANAMLVTNYICRK